MDTRALRKPDIQQIHDRDVERAKATVIKTILDVVYRPDGSALPREEVEYQLVGKIANGGADRRERRLSEMAQTICIRVER